MDIDALSSSRLIDLLNLTAVPRWTIVPVRRSQTVAEHTFRVLVIANELASRLGVILDSAVLWSIIIHDAAESRTGDIPSSFKAALSDGDILRRAERHACPWLVLHDCDPLYDNAGVRAIVKAADLVESFTYLQLWGLDNQRAKTITHELATKMIKLCHDNNVDERVVFALANEIMENA